MFDQYNNQENEKQEYNAGFDSNANYANNNESNQQSFSEQTEGWQKNPQAEETSTNWYSANADARAYNAEPSVQPQSDATNAKQHHRGSRKLVIHSRSNIAAITRIPIITIRV